MSVWDDDTGANDLVDRIFAEMDLQASNSFSPTAQYTGIYNNGRMVMGFKLECAQLYYGSNCATFCQPTDDSSGHYSCDENGGKVCLPEWMDVSTNCITRTSVRVILHLVPRHTLPPAWDCMEVSALAMGNEDYVPEGLAFSAGSGKDACMCLMWR